MYHYEMNELVIKREKAAARELRKSRWWQSKIASHAKCHYCMKSLKKDECTMDHVLPILRGGRSTKGNVVISCKDCNNRKKDSLFVDLPSDVAGLHEPGDQHQKEDQLDIVKPADSAPP
jgi:5-methylcytosine-specific restriction endonuclease McrA